MSIKLGDKVKDPITGFEGIAIGKTEHLHGCTGIGILPQELHDGKAIDTHWFDEPRVEVIEEGVVRADKDSTPTIKLGDTVKDPITGFKGIAMSRTAYLHSCASVGVKPQKMHNGKPIDMHWIDEPRLNVVKKGTFAIEDARRTAAGKKVGGPRDNPPSRTTSIATRG